MSKTLARCPRLPNGFLFGAVMGTALATLPAGSAWAQAPARAAAAPASAASQPAGPTVRKEFFAPTQAAQALLAEGKAKESLAKADEAAQLPGLTPYETYALERTRAAAAQRLGDTALLMKSLEAALATGQTPKDDEINLLEAMVSTVSRAADHAGVLRWSKRYIDLGGPNDAVRVARIQSQFATGDAAGAKSALLARLDAADKAGQVLPESHLRLLAASQQETKDPGVTRTFERLAVAYPRPEYWSDVVSHASRDAGLSDRALLELYRLLRTTGNLKLPDLCDEMAQLSIRMGQPGEALTVVEEAYAAGLMGTGAQAAAHAKIRDQARRLASADRNDRTGAEAAAQRAKDGSGLVDLGWAMIASLPAKPAPAAVEPGLALIEQGIARGGLRRPTEARLHLAMAQLLAGKRDAARQTVATLGTAATAEGIAVPVRLWTMFVQAPEMLPPRQ
jgi:hypothetical protein